MPGAPVALPPHLEHGGSTAYHAPYRCRCAACLEWRRNYDADRNRGRENRTWRPRTVGRSPWYVCVDEFGEPYSWHDYDIRDRCKRCEQSRETEEFWEAKWKEQQS